MRESGVTKEHLARVVVKNRANGADNPNAMFQKATTADDVLASRVVCEPLHLHMLCSPNEGAAAVVLRRATPGDQGVRIAAAALRSHLPGSVLGEATPMSGIDDTGITPPSTLAADAAYAEAGVGPDELDVVECQDTDAARELLGYEELRLCERGGSAALLERGETERGGRRPVNPSGGLLAKGEPLGASALGQVVELTQQLRGTAGPRQVEGARVALAHTVGRGANAAVVILTR
jgi:acetyl-CoA acetyltransferase